MVSQVKNPNSPDNVGFCSNGNNGCQCKTVHNLHMDTLVHTWTPIKYAAKYGYTEIFKCIISKIEKVDNGLKLLELATKGNHVEIVGILLKMLEKPITRA